MDIGNKDYIIQHLKNNISQKELDLKNRFLSLKGENNNEHMNEVLNNFSNYFKPQLNQLILKKNHLNAILLYLDQLSSNNLNINNTLNNKRDNAVLNIKTELLSINKQIAELTELI